MIVCIVGVVIFGKKEHSESCAKLLLDPHTVSKNSGVFEIQRGM